MELSLVYHRSTKPLSNSNFRVAHLAEIQNRTSKLLRSNNKSQEYEFRFIQRLVKSSAIWCSVEIHLMVTRFSRTASRIW